MGNIDSEGSKLDAYYVADLNINYELKLKSIFKSIVFSALVNNIFDSEYVSNGYWYTYDDDHSCPLPSKIVVDNCEPEIVPKKKVDTGKKAQTTRVLEVKK